MSGHSRDFKRCHNPDCYCTGDCIGVTQSAPAVFTERGRNKELPKVSWPERLKAQVHQPGYEQLITPELGDRAIEPSQELGEAWLKGLEFGCEDD